MSEVKEISGVATPHTVSPKWLKKPGDERPCGIEGCKNEGHFIPMLRVWGKKDVRHVGNYYLAILPIVLCAEHAKTDPKEFVPDQEAINQMTMALGDEPDLETMAVQFMGNQRCKVDHAMDAALKQHGLYEPPKVSSARKVE